MMPEAVMGGKSTKTRAARCGIQLGPPDSSPTPWTILLKSREGEACRAVSLSARERAQLPLSSSLPMTRNQLAALSPEPLAFKPIT